MELMRPSRVEGGQLRQRKTAATTAAAAPVNIASSSVAQQQSSAVSDAPASPSFMRSPDRVEYPDLSEPGAAEEASMEVFPGGLQPSAPSFSDPLQPAQYQQLERRPLISQPLQQPRQARAVVQTQHGPRPLSPAALARLEHLRSKARMAEAHEAAAAAAQARGELPPEAVVPIQQLQYRVQAGDDLTDLAVRFGSTVASIQAANRQLVWEHNIEHVVGADTQRDNSEAGEFYCDHC